MAKVKVTQIKSRSGATPRQIANLISLGLHKMHQTVEVELTPVTQGMIQKVLHLVTVEEVAEKKAAKKPAAKKVAAEPAVEAESAETKAKEE